MGLRERIRALLGAKAEPVEPLLEAAARCEASGDAAAAERCYLRAIAAQPDHVEARVALAGLYLRLGMPDDAGALLETAREKAPHDPRVHYEIGRIEHARGHLDAAETALRASIEGDPAVAAPWNVLGLVHRDRGRGEDALACFERALALTPGDPAAVCNIAAAHRMQGDPFLALDVLERHRCALSGVADLHAELATVLAMRGSHDAARAAAEEALALAPGHLLARKTRAHLRLLEGDLARGWDEAEVRRADSPLRFQSRWPTWEGGALGSARLLVRMEEGIGDQVMYASCLPDLFTRVGAERCIVECEPRLAPLYRRSFAGCEVLAAPDLERRFEDEREAVAQIGIASLPRLFRRSFEAFPSRRGYLQVEARRRSAWQDRLESLGNGLKVGVSWAGGSDAGARRLRSAPLTEWGPLLRTSGCRFVSLQYGDHDAELDSLRSALGVTVHRLEGYDPLADLDGMASLIAALDLTVSIDNSTVHLAGAVGVEVWTLLPAVAEWRWLCGVDRSPWYPSMRLFRQTGWSDWASVMAPAAAALRARAEGASR